ncbi:MAG: hypothetical protein U9N81_14020 [Bacillota bacterium]|nr:hypothetical protein [Bacillota bacterium]
MVIEQNRNIINFIVACVSELANSELDEIVGYIINDLSYFRTRT